MLVASTYNLSYHDMGVAGKRTRRKKRSEADSDSIVEMSGEDSVEELGQRAREEFGQKSAPRGPSASSTETAGTGRNKVRSAN